MTIGKLTTNGVILEKHEMRTVVFFLDRGIDIELIPKSNLFGVHTPDIRMLGREWEMKAPIGIGKTLMENTLQKAARQSRNVIVDLRRTKRHQSKCLSELKKYFGHSKSLRNLIIITKNGKIVDIHK